MTYRGDRRDALQIVLKAVDKMKAALDNLTALWALDVFLFLLDTYFQEVSEATSADDVLTL